MSGALSGRIAIVTGASAGIGEATAKELARLGARVVVNARRRDRLDAVVAAINAGRLESREAAGGAQGAGHAGGGAQPGASRRGINERFGGPMDDLGDRPASGGWRSSGGGGSKRAVGVAGDAAEWETIDAMFAAARESFSAEADLVVINAGRGLRGSPISSDEKQWEEMIRVNLLAAARLTRAAAERMTREARGEGGERAPYGLRPAGEYSSAAAHEQARAASASAPADWPRKARDIVMISSTVGKHISPFSSMYGATKFAVTSMAEAARRELAPTGVRVSCVHPGVVRSEFQDVAGYDARTFGEFMERIGPVLEPADVARVVGFIAAQPAGVLVNDVMLRPTRQEYP